MLCLYEAPGAESVRLAQDQARVPYERAWTCAHLTGSAPTTDASASELVVVERVFPTAVTAEFVSTAFKRSGWCLDLHRATYVESYLGGDGKKMVCVFRAPDAESVRLANNQGGVPYTAVWTANVHVPAR